MIVEIPVSGSSGDPVSRFQDGVSNIERVEITFRRQWTGCTLDAHGDGPDGASSCGAWDERVLPRDEARGGWRLRRDKETPADRHNVQF